MLFVAGAIYWVNFAGLTNSQNQMAVQLNDTIRQLQLQNQLQALELAGQQVPPLAENKMQVMQPAVEPARLQVVTVAAATEPKKERSMNSINQIPAKGLQPIAYNKSTNQLMAAALDQTYTRVDDLPEAASMASSGSAIIKSFTKLSSGDYFELAKQKVNEFVSKEHYVNFAIGNIEFGQTIQLSK
jgi:hypothetical protein